MHRLLGRKDVVHIIGNWITYILRVISKLGVIILYFLKFIFHDITIFLCKLPFGNFIGIAYCFSVVFLLKNMMERGEFTRVLFRAIDVYYIQRTPFLRCMHMLQSYIWRMIEPNIYVVWGYTGVPLKRCAKEFVLEHSEQIEKSVTELAKTTAFATVVNVVSRELVSQLGPVAIETFAKSDMARTILDIQQNTGRIDNILDTMHTQLDFATSQQGRIEYAVQSLSDNLKYISMNMASESYLLENNIAFNQKLSEISMQIEYLRITQPSQLREILNTISLSTLALNDVAFPSAVSNIFTRIMDIGSSASQQGRKRIENN